MESITGRYLYITSKYKVLNPAHDAPIYSYTGNIDGYDFKNQKKNLDLIQEKLGKYGMKMDKVYVGKFVGDKKIKTSFISRTEDGRVWWRKYEGKTEGSGENLIFVDGISTKLSNWLKKDSL